MKSHYHYHLIATFFGCYPEYNEVYATKEQAEEAFRFFMEDVAEEEIEDKGADYALLKNCLKIYIEECEGCELWGEAQEGE